MSPLMDFGAVFTAPALPGEPSLLFIHPRLLSHFLGHRCRRPWVLGTPHSHTGAGLSSGETGFKDLSRGDHLASVAPPCLFHGASSPYAASAIIPASLTRALPLAKEHCAYLSKHSTVFKPDFPLKRRERLNSQNAPGREGVSLAFVLESGGCRSLARVSLFPTSTPTADIANRPQLSVLLVLPRTP